MITDRIDNITRIPENYRVVAPPPPKSVKIELTGKCNYRCGFCPLAVRGKPGKDMNIDFFKRITTEMFHLGVEEIGVFFMGEPFTSPKLLIEAIRFLKKDLGFNYVFLTSNASLADPLTVRNVMEAGLDSMKWSVNFSDKGQFQEICGVSDSLLGTALENIRSAKEVRDKYNYNTNLYASSIRYNDEQLDKMESLLSEKVLPYVDQHYWLPLYSMGSLATAKEKGLGINPIPGNPGRYDNPVDPVPCWSLFTEAHVMSDGRVTACGADAIGEWVMGDLNTDSFMSIWNSPQFKELRGKHLENDVYGTKCRNCCMGK